MIGSRTFTQEFHQIFKRFKTHEIYFVHRMTNDLFGVKRFSEESLIYEALMELFIHRTFGVDVVSLEKCQFNVVEAIFHDVKSLRKHFRMEFVGNVSLSTSSFMNCS
jgi:hypothetical protein